MQTQYGAFSSTQIPSLSIHQDKAVNVFPQSQEALQEAYNYPMAAQSALLMIHYYKEKFV